jgi:hypothetical protein
MKITQTWSDGSICERSKRIIEPIVKETVKEDIQRNDIQRNDIQRNDIQRNDIQRNDIQRNDIQRNDIVKPSFFSNRLIDQFEPLHSRDTNNTKREEVYMQIASREMFNKINQNPFLLGNNYVDDINVQEQFLRATTSNPSITSSSSIQ